MGNMRQVGALRQAYHSNSFVGNDCHALLKDGNIEKLCFSLVIVSNLQVIDNDFIADVSQFCTKFQMLFQKSATCHLIYNSAHHLSDIEINLLKLNIQEFKSFYRTNWSDEKVTPKMHMMEDHSGVRI